LLNQVAHLQTEVAHAYMRRHNLKPAEFVQLDHDHNILRFIEIGYEVFHLTGTDCIIDEVENYIALKKQKQY